MHLVHNCCSERGPRNAPALWAGASILLKSGSYNWPQWHLGSYICSDLGHTPLENPRDSHYARQTAVLIKAEECYTRKRVQCTVNVNHTLILQTLGTLLVPTTSTVWVEDMGLCSLFPLLQLRVPKWCNSRVSQNLKLGVPIYHCHQRGSRYPWHTCSKLSCRFTTKIEAGT